MASLATHPNVWSTCLVILQRRGWTLRRVLSPDDESADGWMAIKGEIDLLAENPIELLGLWAIHDEVRPGAPTPYWWSVRSERGAEDIGERLLREATARREARIEELRRLRAADPAAWREVLRVALDNSGSAGDAAAELGVSTAELRRMLEDPLAGEVVRELGWR